MQTQKQPAPEAMAGQYREFVKSPVGKHLAQAMMNTRLGLLEASENTTNPTASFALAKNSEGIKLISNHIATMCQGENVGKPSKKK